MTLKYIKTISSTLVLLLIFSIGNYSFGQEKNDMTVVDKIIAKVDDYIVLKSDLERAYLQMMSQGQSSGPDAKCNILESMVLDKVMVAKADIDSVVVDDEVVDRDLDMKMNAVISQVGGDEKAIEQYYGKSIEEFKEELRDQIKEQEIVKKMQGTILDEIKVTPSEVKKFFKSIPKDSLPYFSTEVTIGEIVKKPEVSKEEEQSIENQLLKLRTRALDGEDFQELAKKYSQGPSAPRGGNLGLVKRGDMLPEFESAALKLKDGEISMPVKTEFGYHIIQMVERRGNEYNCRHILIQPKYSDQDFNKAAKYLDSLRTVILTDSVSFDRAAKEYSEDKYSASNGGFVRSSDGSNSVSVSELDPGLFFAIDTMKIGSISHPMKYTMPDGKQAMRLIYFKDKIKPHQANLEDDYQKIYAAAVNAKKSKAMNDWFIDAKDQVYIEIDPDYESCHILQPTPQ